MFKVFNKFYGEFVTGEGDIDMVFNSVAEAQFCVKVCVMFSNDRKLDKHRWTKRDFQITEV